MCRSDSKLGTQDHDRIPPNRKATICPISALRIFVPDSDTQGTPGFLSLS